MAKTLNPADIRLGMKSDHFKLAQSVHETINGGLDQGVPQTKDSTGNWNSFKGGNQNGVLIRVGASGGAGNQFNWTTNNTALAIPHGLKRQPIGVRLENSDKALQIYQPTTADETYVYVAPSDATANATIYVF